MLREIGIWQAVFDGIALIHETAARIPAPEIGERVRYGGVFRVPEGIGISQLQLLQPFLRQNAPVSKGEVVIRFAVVKGNIKYIASP